jgi:hypothetical protein
VDHARRLGAGVEAVLVCQPVTYWSDATLPVPPVGETLADARARADRLADPYVWLDAYILDAQCTLGRRHRHPDTLRWTEAMRLITARTGMRELGLRSMLHAAAMGVEGSLEAAIILAADIDNPALQPMLSRT